MLKYIQNKISDNFTVKWRPSCKTCGGFIFMNYLLQLETFAV